MIVKNEAEQLERCLDSILPILGAWTICDTGSDDDTREVVVEKLGHLPGRLYEHKWRDFGRNLTLAHARAKGTARWLLWMHADMTAEYQPNVVKDLTKIPRWIHGLEVFVRHQNLLYRLPLLMRGEYAWRYEFPTHEYLVTDGHAFIPYDGLGVCHHIDGSNRSEKYERDLALLGSLFRKQDPRAVFYVAETHRFAGNIEAAVATYDLRASLNGWDEERWYARYQSAKLRGDIEGLFEVWRERPYRHEPLTAAARIIGQVPAHQIDMLFLEPPP